MTELEWIEFLRKKTKSSREVFAPIGDDCAVIRHKGVFLLFTSDMFIENVHFKVGKMSMTDIGRRAAARAMSDIVACGGIPKYLGLSCALPASFSLKNMKAIFSGIEEYCRKYKVSLVGGDTARGKTLFMDVWVVGETEHPLLRSTAREGDHIFITGPLGKLRFDQIFELRVKEVQRLKRRFKINSMIDISDGFSLDLTRVLRQSGKGALIYGDDLPLTRGKNDMFRGEDYELLFTVDKKEDIRRLEKKYFLVGEIRKKSFGCKIIKKGKEDFLDARGYTHF